MPNVGRPPHSPLPNSYSLLPKPPSPSRSFPFLYLFPVERREVQRAVGVVEEEVAGQRLGVVVTQLVQATAPATVAE